MKVLYLTFRHFTEVVFPQLAVRWGWSYADDKHIKTIICEALGIKVPTFPSRRFTSTRDLQRLVTLCRQIEANPLIFLFL